MITRGCTSRAGLRPAARRVSSLRCGPRLAQQDLPKVRTRVASLLRVQLTEQVWLVGSGSTGFSTTHPRDCHVYMIASDGDGVLIDTGAGIDVSPLLAEIERAGAASVVDRILVTHAHADHSGGAAELREALGAEVHASHEVATYLRNGDAEKASFDVMKAPGGYPDDYWYHSCKVDAELVAGQRLAVGSLEVEVVPASGHSSGHLAFALHRPGGVDLFSGDAAFAHGRVLLQDLWDCSIRESTRTIRRFAKLKPDGFYPGHGLIAISEGWNHIYSAMDEILSGLPPRQLTF